MASSLPFDVLCEILDLFLPPKFLVSPADSQSSTASGPWRRSMAQKCCLSVVCKTWRAAALRLLFSDVVIGSADQAASFLDALGLDVGRFVRSIEYALVQDDEREICLDTYQKIRVALPNVRCIALELEWPRVEIAEAVSQLGLTCLTMAVRATDGVSPSDVTGVLRAVSGTLTRLHLLLFCFSVKEIPEDSKVGEAPNHVDFEKLAELELTFTSSFAVVSEFVEHWSLPHMTKVTIHGYDYCDFLAAWSCVRMNRAQIVYLHLDVDMLRQQERRAWEAARRCIGECESLRHLVVRVRPERKGLRSDSVAFIDVWDVVDYEELKQDSKNAMRLCGCAGTQHVQRQRPNRWTEGKAPRLPLRVATRPPDEPNVLPRLREVRVLDETLGRLPIDVPPEKVLCEEDDFGMRYDGIHVRHEVGRLMRVPEMDLVEHIGEKNE